MRSPRLLVIAIVAFLVAVILGPGRERPADLTPTPTRQVIVLPTSTAAPGLPSSPVPSVPTSTPVPEALVLTPTATLVPASSTPSPTPVPSDTPTTVETRVPVQRG